MEHEVAKLIGAPPGYLGHRETQPMLTQQKLNAVTSEIFRLDVNAARYCGWVTVATRSEIGTCGASRARWASTAAATAARSLKLVFYTTIVSL